MVLPGARASSIGLKTTVVGAGLSELSGDRAKVLVFLDQSATAADGQKPIGFSETADAGVAKTSSARWAFMRKVNGNWLLSDLQPVGDVTR